MKKFIAYFSLFILISCGDKETDLSIDAPIKPNEFVAAFPLLEKNFTASDKEIIDLADSIKIHPRHLNRFIPDSIINSFAEGEKKYAFHALGRIEKNAEIYLLLVSVRNKLPTVFVVAMDKKNNYLASKKLYAITKDDNYNYTLTINREPTFFVSKERTTTEKEFKYTKTGWAFMNKNFVNVVKETNERSEKLTAIVNPIDLLAKNNPYSGDYVEDDRNFIALRDGRTRQEYIFFLHIEKDNGKCIGELKGEMKLTDSTHAVYLVGGDPCIINFSFGRNSISIKEKGSCGNRRGMDCFFDDAYPKKKEPKKKGEKSTKI
ncbi:MAG: hypothetical protein KGZ59_08470 [Chitinophagaceae bacterium]|nr:hypothetical protein [Chitinophagaceae bacterium]